MANNENEKILESARLLERWENTPAPWEDPYSDMSDIEKSKLILYLMEQREEQRKREESQQKQIAELMRNSQQTTEKLDKYIQQISALMNQICELTRLLKQKDQEISDLKSRLKLGQRIRYSKTSQKRSSRKKDDDDKPTPHTDAESGFDGSEESLPENMDVDTPEESSPSKAILGDSQIKALQTDGYAAYLYLDKDIVDIEHLCCMAHVRAKFLYALEIEHDETARQFLKWIEQLYLKESYYERMQLSPHEIKVLRNSQDTEDIKQKMREKLDLMLSDCAPGHGDLMRRAVKYLDHFWNQVFLYQRDGEYTIDNNLAERFIRPLTNERKNFLFFGSHKMARVSAAYHSVISTCRYHGISILEYLKKFFTEIVAGNRDYQKLMPSTIGISANKL